MALFAARLTLLASLAAAIFAAPAIAQDISEEHQAAARAALSATKATAAYDSILFDTSAQIKNRLTSQNPDLSEQISTIVDEEAIKLAPRRADLENEAAILFANTFSMEELVAIETFFSSDTGSKYLENAPILGRELGRAARVWANGIGRDLSTNVGARVNEIAPPSAEESGETTTESN
jgi:hypothetical protein